MTEISDEDLKRVVEAMLFASEEPLNVASMLSVFKSYYDEPSEFRVRLVDALDELTEDCESRGIELVQVASGFRYQVDSEHGEWVRQLRQRNPPRYSRALMETLAMVAYKQPITRAEIEDVRGVKTSGNILRTLRERGWIRELGRKQVPGLPILYGTTRQFLDYFNLRSLADLPPYNQDSSLLVEEDTLEAPKLVTEED